MFELFRTVGNSRENRTEDVFAVKDALSDFGFFDFGSNKAEPHGIFTRELDEGIKDFQSQNGLRVDGILKPKGETENALRQRLAAKEPRSRLPKDIFIYVPEQKSEFDATGRMIRPEEMGKRRDPLFSRDVLLSLAEKYKPKPFGEEAIKKKLQERQVRFAAAGNNAAQSKPSVPVPKEKPIVSELSRKFFDVKKAPVVNREKDRINSILNNTPAKFDIKFKKTDKILREAAIDTFVRNNDIARKTLEKHSETVERFSKKHGVDPDLVKAIMWDENARGDKFGTNRLFDSIGSSQRPMNINGDMWSKLIGKKSSRLHDPEENIETSIILIKRIGDRIEKPTPGKVASIWNVTGRENTNEFGNDVDIIYNQKPWTQKK
ncbi:MAG: peptidoglycan-binding protein [Alphaproteobacteria bacterium]|nr:peptidoglycan-binding protein [Alphaproteobacteria bacterium]